MCVCVLCSLFLGYLISACIEKEKNYCWYQKIYHIPFLVFQITQHKWAWPFMQPVDVEGLGLHDYYKVESLASFLYFHHFHFFILFFFFFYANLHVANACD